MNAWLHKNGVCQSLFASEVLGWKQSRLSDALRMPPAELPKGQGKFLWEKMEKFLQDKCGQEQLIALKKGTWFKGLCNSC